MKEKYKAMTNYNFKIRMVKILIAGLIVILPAMSKAQYRPSLFFREDWKEIPPVDPITQEHVNNPDLVLNLYGPGKEGVRKSNHDHPDDDPFYVWSGMCQGNWAVTLKHKTSFADLTEFAKIKWRSKQSGFRQLRILLKLADSSWLVSNQYDDASKDWRIREFNIQDITWYAFDMKLMSETTPVENPDLTKVDEIGFTDLMPGGRSNACSRLDWIEVYAKPVTRKN